ncbi:MAG: AMP-binding protein [Thermomicrobiales bacterium]
MVAGGAPVRVEVLLDEAMRAQPDATVLLHGARTWTYRALRAEMARRGAVLRGAGLVAGTVVLSTERVSDEVLVSCLACCRADVVFCHLSPHYTAAELLPLATRAGARVVLTADGTAHPLLPDLPALPIDLPGEPAGGAATGEPEASGSAEATALLAATSGTTALLPKLAIIPHRALTWRRHLPTWAEARPGAVASTMLSLKGLVHQFCIAVAQGNPFVVPSSAAPARLERELARHGVVDFLTQPSLLNVLLENPQPPPDELRLRTIRSGSSTLSPDVAQRIAARYQARVIETYSSTESSQCIGIPEAGAPPGSIGTPFAGVAVRIVDPDGCDVPEGEVGELIVQHPGIMGGYLGDEAATALAIRDGWYWSGDLARRDAAGFFYLAGRRAAVLNVGGYKVSPEEVEAVLLQHPGVREAVVVPQPDAKRGEIARAVIVPRGVPPTPTELRRFCLARLARYKVPRRWEFRDDLPRSPLGKVLRQRL